MDRSLYISHTVLLDKSILEQNWRSFYIFLHNFIYTSQNTLINDILLATNDLSLLYETKRFLSNNFAMKDMDEATYVTGIEIFWNRSQGMLGLSKKSYINKVLEIFRMQNCSTTPVLIQKGDKFSLM